MTKLDGSFGLGKLDSLYVRRDGTLALTANWDAGSFEIEILNVNIKQGGSWGDLSVGGGHFFWEDSGIIDVVDGDIRFPDGQGIRLGGAVGEDATIIWDGTASLLDIKGAINVETSMFFGDDIAVGFGGSAFSLSASIDWDSGTSKLTFAGQTNFTDTFTVSATNTLISQNILHLGDTNTGFVFLTDRIAANAGGVTFLDATEAATDTLKIGGSTWANTITGTTTTFVSGIIKRIVNKTADYLIVETDYTIVADATSNTVTITLPASPNTGQIFVVKCEDSTFTCTVGRNGNNIDGDAADVTLVEDEVVMVIFDGTEWWII